MSQLTIFVDEKTFDVKHDESVDAFVQRALNGRIGYITFNDENFLMKNHGLSIQDTDLCNGDTLRFNDNFKTLFYPEGYVIASDNGKLGYLARYGDIKVPLKNFSLFKILEALTLSSRHIFPHDLIDQSYLDVIKIDNAVSGDRHYYGYPKLSTDLEDIIHSPSEFFTYDLIIPKKLEIRFPEIDYDFSDTLLKTGSVISGFYVGKLMKFYKNELLCDNMPQIYSYTLDFLRDFLKIAFANHIPVKVTYKACKSFYKYEIIVSKTTKSYSLEKDITFYHLGMKDIHISAEENRKLVKQYLLKTVNLTCKMTCYDGEIVQANNLVKTDEVYVRLTKGITYLNPRERRIKYIPVPEVNMEITTGYSYYLSEDDGDYYRNLTTKPKEISE